ncbi:MAG: SDR family oxidoreductase [Pseudomonadota bacterium]
MRELENTSVVITGASRGIGESAAYTFAEAGARVVLLARDVAACNRTRDAIEASGGTALALACDVADYGQVQQALSEAHSRCGSLDVLINNAGVIDPIACLDTVDPAAWSHAVDINLKGVFNGVHIALPMMLAQGGGRILNVSSGAAQHALPGWSHYCAAKAGSAMLTRCVHAEFGDQGITVMGLSPGTVATDMQVKIKASGINAVSQLDPSVHIDPSWPAKALVWMCGEDASAFAGEEISLRDATIRAKLGLS